MKFRHALPADAGAIAALHANSWASTYRGVLADAYLDGDMAAERRSVWMDRFREPAANQYIVIAEDDIGMAGFACAYGGQDAECGTLLENLHVAPGRKGQGIGVQMMANVARWSVANYPGCGMHLFVVEQNLPARRFYERLGGVVNGDEAWHAPDGSTVHALRYAWSRMPDAWLATAP